MLTPPAEVNVPAKPPWPIRFDHLLVASVLAFAFLAASFPARNSDVWRHLAGGRLLAEGQVPFGVDPFSHLTEGRHWVNHSWLYDWLLFQAFQRLGGSADVAGKALLVVILAGILLRATRGPRWPVAGVVLLGVTAMTPRLQLQPFCMSLVLLAACLWLLQRGGRGKWLVPPAIALWVNFDDWFILGPLLVAMFWLVQRWKPASAEERLSPAFLAASFAACLASPFHVHCLTLPAELSPAVWGSSFRDDGRFAYFFASPWPSLGNPPNGFSLAAWSFVTLLVLGAISFLTNRAALRDWRGIVWLLFASLAAWQVRLVPFFAVAGGIIAARNFADVASPRLGGRVARWLTLTAVVAFALLTVPGWLTGLHSQDRGIAWRIEANPSLVKAGETLTAERLQRVHTTHPDAAHHLAWFAPGTKTSLDSRIAFFTPDAAEQLELDHKLIANEPHALHLDCVLLFDPNPRRYLSVSVDPQWMTQVRVLGDAVVHTGTVVAYAGPERRAFLADEQLQDRPATPAAVRDWWDFTPPPTVSTWQASAAAMYLRIFEETAARERIPTAILGVTGPTPFAFTSPSRSPALPLFAVRHARQAVAEKPTAMAWFVLARGHLHLSRDTWEATAEPTMLFHLRTAQATAALVQSVRIDPDFLNGHAALAGLFGERQFLDLAYRHRAIQVRLTRRAGAFANESADAFDERLRKLSDAANQQEKLVQDAENRYLVRSLGMSGNPLGRARLALQLGLADKALDGVLLKSHPDLYGVEGLRLLASLLIATGRGEELRVLLDRDELKRNSGSLGTTELVGGMRQGQPWGHVVAAYDWFDLCSAASVCHDSRAIAALDRMTKRVANELQQSESLVVRAVPGSLASEAGLGSVGGLFLPRLLATQGNTVRGSLLTRRHQLAAQLGGLELIAGALSVEAGRESARYFQSSLDSFAKGSDAPASGGRAVAERYLRQVSRATLQSPR